MKIQRLWRRMVRWLFRRRRSAPRLVESRSGGQRCAHCKGRVVPIVYRGLSTHLFADICAGCSSSLMKKRSMHVPVCCRCGKPDASRIVTGPYWYQRATLAAKAQEGPCPECVSGQRTTVLRV